jgi:hypothetical protein
MVKSFNDRTKDQSLNGRKKVKACDPKTVPSIKKLEEMLGDAAATFSDL